MLVRIISHVAVLSGEHLRFGRVMDMEDATAQAFISTNQAEPVASEAPPAAAKEDKPKSKASK